MGQGSSDRYYEEARAGQIMPFKAADLSHTCAHGCWTGGYAHHRYSGQP